MFRLHDKLLPGVISVFGSMVALTIQLKQIVLDFFLVFNYTPKEKYNQRKNTAKKMIKRIFIPNPKI